MTIAQIAVPVIWPLLPPVIERLASANLSARLRIALCYAWRHRRLVNLSQASRFTELVQRRKLNEPPAQHAALLDKLAAKNLAARMLGPEWTVPTLWSGETLPSVRPFACPAILKARHGCNQNRILRQPPGLHEWQALRRQTLKWTHQPYGLWLDEPAYSLVPRGLLAEPLLDAGTGTLPVDYKIYVFGGQAAYVQVHLDRGGAHRWILHDWNWRQLVPSPDHPPRPGSLPAMIEAAETLAAGMDFVRVDFYEIGGKPLFGEFCLYPGSGLDPFAADWIDAEMGALWLAAIERRHQPGSATSAVSDTNTSSRSGSRVVTSSIP